ncbi:MAG: rhodanese-like domain-containing protein [Aquabacterium sp.]
MIPITVAELALWRHTGFGHRLLDVRRRQARAADGTTLSGARWLDPSLWLDWKDGIEKDQPVVVYCAFGHEISQGLTAALRAMGADARHLDGGIAAWKAAGEATQPVDAAGVVSSTG